jgi:hypothetical protein
MMHFLLQGPLRPDFAVLVIFPFCKINANILLCQNLGNLKAQAS